MLAEQRTSDYQKRRHGTLRLALLGMLVLQLSSALHHFEHVAGYVDTTCEMCVQLDRVNDAVPGDATPSLELSIVSGPAPRLLSENVASASVRDFDARAPPYL